MYAIIWLVILVAMLIIEIATLGLTTIWFAGGALIAFVAAMLQAPPVLQIILFLIVSFALLFLTRPIAVKYFNKDRVRTNAESLVGRQGIVKGEINNLLGTGLVVVSGQEWTARAKEDDINIAIGTVVHIISINGVKLIVEEKQEEL